jgi:hypothetical protein
MTNSKEHTTNDLVKVNADRKIKIPTIRGTSRTGLSKTSGLSECLLHIDVENRKRLWEKQRKILRDLTDSDPDDHTTNGYSIFTEKNAILSFIDRLYSINRDDYKLAIHLLPLDNYTFNEHTSEFILEYNRTNMFNMHTLMLFNKTLMDYEKILFVFYQLLHVIREANRIGINTGALAIGNLYLDDNYFLKVQLDFNSLIKLYESVDLPLKGHQKTIKIDRSFPIDIEQVYDSYRHLNLKDLSRATVDWCLGKIANFDYLLILNCISGREMNKPLNHPIFPWIYDFKTSLRDLNRTKFRLNKGDQHLDHVYQASGCTYHITEFQSDITYFVYKSRCTDKTVLCKHVRSKWVPYEYPASMERLYEWTPVG